MSIRRSSRALYRRNSEPTGRRSRNRFERHGIIQPVSILLRPMPYMLHCSYSRNSQSLLIALVYGSRTISSDITTAAGRRFVLSAVVHRQSEVGEHRIHRATLSIALPKPSFRTRERPTLLFGKRLVISSAQPTTSVRPGRAS